MSYWECVVVVATVCVFLVAVVDLDLVAVVQHTG